MVTLTNAEGYVIPSDLREAIAYTYEKLKKLLSERKAMADSVRDVVKDAKRDGYSTKAVRQAMRLDRLTPEQREKWCEHVNIAAALFGLSGLTGLDNDDRDQKLWAYVQQTRYLQSELKDLAALLKDLRTKASERGVDWQALAYLIRLEPKEPDERKEWVERLDAMASSLGYW